MPTDEELLLMPENEYKANMKSQNKERRELIRLNKRYERYATKRYDQLAKRNQQEEKLAQLARREKIKRTVKNARELGRGVHGLAKAITSQRYSEAGRLSLISNLYRGAPEPRNILNARNIFYSKKKYEKQKYSL